MMSVSDVLNAIGANPSIDDREKLLRRWGPSLNGADELRIYAARNKLIEAGFPANMVDPIVKQAIGRGGRRNQGDQNERTFGDGIIDIVLGTDGRLAWLVVDGNEPKLVPAWNGLKPWPRSALPWKAIPNAQDVELLHTF